MIGAPDAQGFATAIPLKEASQGHAVITQSETPGCYNIMVGLLYVGDNGNDVTLGTEKEASNFVLESQHWTGIDDVIEDKTKEEVPSHLKGTFNLAGQRVGDDYKGFVIRDGKKCFIK